MSPKVALPNDVAIRVSGIGKQYEIGAAVERHQNLREALIAGAKRPVKRLANFAKGKRRDEEDSHVWAVRDISFELKRGEVLGVIGRNGAGKSTLLKILSRITRPSEGRAHVRGRVGSLLEVGTGFSGELSGRENVFLNGSILGMDRQQITRRFDEIVEFSGVGKFIDTPVKRYSSGMYLRLAFAVAAHLEPDVLIVDEVLAVGDAEFQNKCVGKMSEVAGQGRTVLFVSHNLAAVARLCTRAILLKQGRLVMDASVDAVRQAYVAAAEQAVADESGFDDSRRQAKSREAAITNAWLESDGERRKKFDLGDTVEVVLQVRVNEPVRLAAELVLRDQTHAPVAFFASGFHRQEFACAPGETLLRMRVPNVPLAQGRYSFDLAVVELGKRYLDQLESALTFEVLASDPLHNGCFYLQGKGSIYLPSDFSVASGPATEVRH